MLVVLIVDDGPEVYLAETGLVRRFLPQNLGADGERVAGPTDSCHASAPRPAPGKPLLLAGSTKKSTNIRMKMDAVWNPLAMRPPNRDSRTAAYGGAKMVFPGQ